MNLGLKCCFVAMSPPFKNSPHCGLVRELSVVYRVGDISSVHMTRGDCTALPGLRVKVRLGRTDYNDKNGT